MDEHGFRSPLLVVARDVPPLRSDADEPSPHDEAALQVAGVGARPPRKGSLQEALVRATREWMHRTNHVRELRSRLEQESAGEAAARAVAPERASLVRCFDVSTRSGDAAADGQSSNEKLEQQKKTACFALGATVVQLDARGRTAALDDGERVRYDECLLATGSVDMSAGLREHVADERSIRFVGGVRTWEDRKKLRGLL